MLVTVLGPDGTGKTTLAKELAKKLENFEYIYFGYNKENRSYRFFEKFIKSDKNNPIFKALRKPMVFINDLYYYSLAKRKNIISDRCPVDNYIATKIRGSKMQYYYGFLAMISPNPDYVFLLEGDSKVIYKRKEEISINKIELTIKFYKAYLRKKGIKNTCIDTTKNDIDQTILIAKEIMNNKVK